MTPEREAEIRKSVDADYDYGDAERISGEAVAAPYVRREYEEARGAVPMLSGMSPEEIIRRMRDAWGDTNADSLL